MKFEIVWAGWSQENVAWGLVVLVDRQEYWLATDERGVRTFAGLANLPVMEKPQRSIKGLYAKLGY